MITRRTFLDRAAKAGVSFAWLPVLACAPGGSTSSDTGDTSADDGPLGPPTTFQHGVASGDPLSDSVLVWTRVSPGDAGIDGIVDLRLDVATDPEFADVVATGSYTAVVERDWCLTVDVTDLDAGTTYYFRFTSLRRTSPVGRTRTAPTGAVDRLRFGVCSCSNLAFGWFHAYAHLAERADLDAVLHLGDYIYEYADAGFGRTYGTTRPLDPPTEIISLEDYRRRYAHYRKDADLAEVHRQHPMIHVWDDHEFANDPEIGGADNHTSGTEGDWDARRDRAVQAYLEWMPTRMAADGDGRIFRELAFGDLARVLVLDRQRRFLWPSPDDDHYLGKEQADWLDARLAEPSATWMVFAQGTRFAPRRADGSGASWDAESRRRTLDAVTAGGHDNLLVLTGDIHKFDALDVAHDPAAYTTTAGSEGVELAVGSISSPGTTTNTSGVDHYLWSDGTQRGFVVVELTPTQMHADAFGFPDLAKLMPERPLSLRLRSFTAPAGANRLTEVDAAMADVEGPPLAP